MLPQSVPAIDVLLATYNGARYLEEQLDSLFAQTHSGFRIIARDDGSSDATLAILERYRQQYGDKLLLILNEAPSGSARGNFARLTQLSDADYTMYCDQDDYWHPQKIEKTLAAMCSAEIDAPGSPIMVHGDLRVVDADRRVISPSFWSYQGLDASITSANRLIVQNNITGCTVMINRALRMKAQPIPDAITMHDWWLGLVASLFGKIVTISESLIDYRQHGSNDTGAKNYNLSYVLQRVRTMFTADRLNEFRQSVARSKVQAQSLLDALGSEMPPEERRLIRSYVEMESMNAVTRRYFAVRNGFLKQGLARNIAYLLTI